MKRVVLPPLFYLFRSLLLALVSLYIFSEAQSLQRELLRQTEAKGPRWPRGDESKRKKRHFRKLPPGRANEPAAAR